MIINYFNGTTNAPDKPVWKTSQQMWVHCEVIGGEILANYRLGTGLGR